MNKTTKKNSLIQMDRNAALKIERNPNDCIISNALNAFGKKLALIPVS